MAKFSSLSLLTVSVLLLVKSSLSTPIIESEPGGLNRIDIYEPNILKFVDLARKEYSRSKQTTYEPIIIEVSQVTSQTVSGIMYRINLIFAASVCKKGNKNCVELRGGRRDKCSFEVWSQPWIDHGSPQYKLNC